MNANDPLVMKLMKWRHNAVVHRNSNVAIGKSELLDNEQLRCSQIDEPLAGALNIYNRCSSYFRASTASPNFVGEDDYESVIEYIREGVARRESDAAP